ncbi:MAG: hypothetical protein K2G12_03430 [Prevotella sp.]|nr:hypothetical protein [Prevotella sp.]
MKKAKIIHDMSELQHDMIELVFDKDSPDYISQLPSCAGIIPDRADKTAFPSHRATVKRVGVFVDDMPQNIVMRVYNYDLDYIKLCGNESATYIENIKHTLIPDIIPDIKIIKCVSSLDAAFEYMECVDVLLVQ